MKSLRFYISLTLASVLLLAGFVLFSPDAEKQGESLLWKKQFKEIRIIRGSRSEDTISLERRGIFYQNYFIKHNNENRLGGTPVQNVFRDWSEPVIKGIYTDYSFEEDPAGIQLELYEAPKAVPSVIRFGPKTGSSDRFIELKEGNNAPVYFIIQDSLFTRLFTDPLKMREKRVLVFPSGTYIENAVITYPRPLEKGKSIEALRIESFKKKESPDGPELLRYRRSTGEEIEKSLSDTLERYLKQISIHRFRDESGFTKEEMNTAFRTAGEDLLMLEITLKRPGENAVLRFREIPENIKFDDKERYFLLYNQSSGETDFILKNNVQSVISQAEAVRNAPAVKEAPVETPE